MKEERWNGLRATDMCDHVVLVVVALDGSHVLRHHARASIIPGDGLSSLIS